MKLTRLLLFLFLITASSAQAKDCYLRIERAGDYNPAAIQSFSTPLITRYFQKVKPPPPGGFSLDACQYTISVSENRNSLSVVISGPELQAFGDSTGTGMPAVREAILRAILRAKPQKKGELCQIYGSILSLECKGKSAQRNSIQTTRRGNNSPMAEPPPPPPPPIKLEGHLQINVNAPNVKAYLNNRSLGTANPGKPLNKMNLTSGKALLRLEAKGFASEEQVIEIKPKKWVQLAIELTALTKSVNSNKMQIRTSKKVVPPYTPIKVLFHGLPGNSTDWFTIVKAGSRDNTYKQYFYSNGEKTGYRMFKGLRPDTYEVRLYLNWPQGDYNVVSRYQFEVR